ncbi:hypothetical protein A3K55_01995 [Candidatus Shapirobacteria bacterium RBG_13_44_7]|uniref:DUF962 family protein n=1 Tax=Candidatus Shapirobacteria bacterium RBG_13_44_7 TaxID=1802149 RepID=A0A1F7SHG0_9BACT|nr:MAG: hypothetical protein A3K55_01995 [Candidatus Shapirobacteria bacterium RBG_13_44_7]
MYQKLIKYYSKHPQFNAIAHLCLGIGLGVLITYPLVGTHPLRWGLAFIILGLLGHFYPLFAAKK